MSEAPWQDIAHRLRVTLLNQEQTKHNMFRAYVVGQAWRLYRAMCDQRRHDEDFAIPPQEIEEIKLWISTLG